MSLSVSAVVKPSRLLRLLLRAYALLHLAVALCLLADGAGQLSGGRAVALLCLLVAVLAGRAAGRREMRQRIDISGPGTIRLTVQQRLGSAGARRLRVRLLPGSTVWSRCLLLLLRPEKGGVPIVLPVMPDSVDPAAFRSLSVAIRHISARNKLFVEIHKIL